MELQKLDKITCIMWVSNLNLLGGEISDANGIGSLFALDSWRRVFHPLVVYLCVIIRLCPQTSQGLVDRHEPNPKVGQISTKGTLEKSFNKEGRAINHFWRLMISTPKLQHISAVLVFFFFFFFWLLNYHNKLDTSLNISRLRAAIMLQTAT